IGALSGTYFMYSTGLADENDIARMLGKSGAGSTRWKTIVSADGAETPASGCLSTYDAIAGAADLTFEKPSQYAFMPTIVLVKYPGAPVGDAGLQSSLNSRTKSAAVTWRGGVVLHLIPG